MQTVSVPETLHPGGLELTKRAIELCSPRPGERLVDLGCGGGAAVQLAGCEYGLRAMGIDLRQEALRAGREAAPALRVACSRASRLPLEAESCDILLAECSLSATGDLAGVLDECRRVLVPGGWLAITDLYRRAPFTAPAAAADVTHLILDRPQSIGANVKAHHPGEETLPKQERSGGPCLTSPPAPSPSQNRRWRGGTAASGCGGRRRPIVPDQTGWITLLEAAGFDVLLWEDHTPALTSWAAQAIFAGRSLASLWGCSAGAIDVSPETFTQLRLGYCLIVAQKRNLEVQPCWMTCSD